MDDNPDFPVVALGGSAGGLAAFKAFLAGIDALDAPPGMAFIVVPHLAPNEASYMADLLARGTRLPVAQVSEATAMEPDRVYVLRPNEMLTIEAGWLTPLPRAEGHEPPHPVDDLFFALADSLGPRAGAVILSGTGRNGSAGLAAVHERGGIVLAQTPEEAEFGDMPRNAIDTGFVGTVLAAEEMAAVLYHALRVAPAAPADSQEAAAAGPDSDSTEPDAAAYRRILAAAQAHSRIDFDQYKSGTLTRRIERRVFLHQSTTWSAYADFLEGDEAERRAIVDDLLITVTGFFRDPDAWAELARTAVAPLVAAKGEKDPLRVWVAGCASGEEAYSLAILLFEEAEAQGRRSPIEVFATDASERALARAREGLYPAAAVQQMDPSRRRRFFAEEHDSVRVRGWLRERVVFAPHDLMQDAPFSRLDVVMCRNVLIYLRPDVQQRLLRLFHFALREGGYLFIGPAEHLGEAEEHFDTVSKSAKLFRRRGPTRHDIVDFPQSDRRGRNREPSSVARADTARPQIAETALRALAERHAPPSVLIDGDFRILYYQGATERVLGRQSGEPSDDLLTLVRGGFGPRLRRLVEDVSTTGEAAAARVPTTTGSGPGHLELQAAPVATARGDRYFLVSFVEETPSRAAAPATSREGELEHELELLREELGESAQSTSRVEEDFKAYNEEIVSMNEELRAANEELETSKEELQSLNEELNTVNEQLHARLEDLQERTDDLHNLLSNTGIATLFLDRELNVRWFSPTLDRMFAIRDSDIGRPITDLSRRFEDAAFAADCEGALRDLVPLERRIASEGGEWFQRRIAPYRASDDRIEGVCVTFADVTEIESARAYAELVVETVPLPFLVLDPELRVVSANAAFYERYGIAQEETVGRLVYQLGDGAWNIPELRRLLEDVLPADEAFRAYEVSHDFGRLGLRTMLLSGRRVADSELVLLAIEDITERKADERQKALLMSELTHRVKNALTVVQSLASQTLNRSESLEDFRRVFQGRLAAFARGHSELLGENWQTTDIGALVRSAIEAHGADDGQVTADGPEAELAPKPGMALALALHELETNAAKYGALSAEGGRIAITWGLDGDGLLRLVWKESGGPEVAPPETVGLGTQLIEQIIGAEAGGSVAFDYAAEGLGCTLTLQPGGRPTARSG